MKTYHVHFSDYDEDSGDTDESVYTVIAENPAAARREARLLRDRDDNAPRKPGDTHRKYAAPAEQDEETELDDCGADDWEDEL